MFYTLYGQIWKNIKYNNIKSCMMDSTCYLHYRNGHCISKYGTNKHFILYTKIITIKNT